MRITIDVPDEVIDDVLCEPHARYWCREASWSAHFHVGACVDGETGAKFPLNRTVLKRALSLMATHHSRSFARLLSASWDGETGDILLQLMAFGEVRYG